jgi:hypothetical protein
MTKPKRCTNAEMWRLSTARQPFKNNNGTAWGQWLLGGNLYAVYSYGAHFPMYVYDNQTSQWYGNSDKYSRTTTRHQTQALPRVGEFGTPMVYAPTQELMQLISHGGTVPLVQRRLEQAHLAQ